MIVIDENFKETDDIYIALGSFDGLHKGHMSLITKVSQLAKTNGGKSMVYTFKDHPLNTINPKSTPKLIMDNDTKLNLLSGSDIDFVLLQTFDDKFMKLSPENFIISICKRFNIKGMVVGFNYRFGYKNQGDIELLFALSKKYNFNLTVMNPFKDKNTIISSTLIRQLIKQGNIKKANSYLSMPFMIKGNVVRGKGLGKTIGYPTANIDYDKRYVLPGEGVYYTNVKYNETFYRGITSVGFNPTVYGEKLTIETYILDFNENIYGKEIHIYFIEKTREQIKFPTVENLVEQLKLDEKSAKMKKIYINLDKNNLQ